MKPWRNGSRSDGIVGIGSHPVPASCVTASMSLHAQTQSRSKNWNIGYCHVVHSSPLVMEGVAVVLSESINI